MLEGDSFDDGRSRPLLRNYAQGHVVEQIVVEGLRIERGGGGSQRRAFLIQKIEIGPPVPACS